MACGSTVCDPLGCTAPIPLIVVSTESVLCQLSAGGLPAIDVRVRNAEAAGYRRNYDEGTGGPGLKASEVFHLFAARPVNRLHLILGGVNDGLFVRDHGYVARPNRHALVGDGEVVRTGWQQKILKPGPVMVKLIHMAHEIIGLGAVGEHHGWPGSPSMITFP